MSTPALIVFVQDDQPRAAVYRHWNGSPDIMLEDLVAFAADVCADVPFGIVGGTAERLAAQYLVWDARRTAVFRTLDPTAPSGVRETPAPALNFGSIWPVMALDSVDVAYAYVFDFDAAQRRREARLDSAVPLDDADGVGPAESWPDLRWARVQGSLDLGAATWTLVPAIRATVLRTLYAQGRVPFRPKNGG